MIPGELTSQKDTTETKHYPWPVLGGDIDDFCWMEQ